eukprot:scaffold651541_cov46-Prasinocladus_malaysianus.AAC.1
MVVPIGPVKVVGNNAWIPNCLLPCLQLEPFPDRECREHCVVGFERSRRPGLDCGMEQLNF